MTESMERARVSRRSFLGGVGVTAGGLMVASGERSYLVRGTDSGTVLRPAVVSTDLNRVDSDKGLVHLATRTRSDGFGFRQRGAK
jgi:hypothetical protein